jgi:hypothetical protein
MSTNDPGVCADTLLDGHKTAQASATEATGNHLDDTAHNQLRARTGALHCVFGGKLKDINRY